MLIIENLDVVSGNVPFLFGLCLLHKYKSSMINLKDIMYYLELKIEILCEGKYDHIYLPWNTKSRIRYNRPELVHFYKNFLHPTSKKLQNILKLARPWEVI